MTEKKQKIIWGESGTLDLNNYEIVAGKAVFNRLAAMVAESRILPDSDLYPPEYILHAGGAPIMSRGELTLWIGKAKTKKTAAQSMIVAAILKGTLEYLKATRYSGKNRIIWFDTEQSPYYVQTALKRALQLACGASDISVEVYALRPYGFKERQQIINQVLDNDNPENDVLLAIIDGIRDLVSDINDPDQATDLVTWVMKLTATKGLHISCILHQNKGDQNARGHVGTEFTNKAETVFSTEKDTKDDRITWIKGEYTRNIAFEPFAFIINEDGLPEILPDQVLPAEKTSRPAKTKPWTLQPDTHEEIRDQVFSQKDSYGWTELCLQIQVAFAAIGIEFGQSAAREYLTYWESLDLIRSTDKENGKKRVFYAKTTLEPNHVNVVSNVVPVTRVKPR